MVHHRKVQLIRAMTVFVVTGWACAVAVLITDSKTSVMAALLGAPAIRSAILGFAVGLPWVPLAAWSTSKGLVKLGQGALAGTLGGLLGVTVYFQFWPPEWNAGTMATLKVFYATYGLRVGPLTTLGGIVAAWWSAQVPVVAPLGLDEG